jgi:uncharacterized integral membrane protein
VQRRSWVILFVARTLVALVTRTGPTSAHEWARLGTVESVVERWTYSLEESKFRGTRDKIFRNGHFYSHQPPVLATLESPVYWVIHQFGLSFSNNSPFDLAYYLFVVLTNGLALALTVVVMDLVLGLVGAASPMREVHAFLLPMGTWLLPYGVVTANHGIAGLLLMLLVYLLLTVEWHGVTAKRCAGLGLVLGLLTVVEVLPGGSFVPLSVAYLWSRAGANRAYWKALAAGLAGPLLLHAVLNWPITGDLVPAGFHSELFDYPGTTFDAASLTGTLKHTTVSSFLDYASQALFAGKGYFILSPLLVVGLIAGFGGWRWWGRARGVQVTLLGGSIASLLIALLTTNNLGGVAVGFRHATYLAPAMLALLCPVLEGRSRAAQAASVAVAALSLVSFVVLLLYAVPAPWSSLTYPIEVPVRAWTDYLPIVANAFGAER